MMLDAKQKLNANGFLDSFSLKGKKVLFSNHVVSFRVTREIVKKQTSRLIKMVSVFRDCKKNDFKLNCNRQVFFFNSGKSLKLIH